MPLPGETNFNLHSFRTTVGDPARPYLFEVSIPEIGSEKVMTAMARSTILPGYNLQNVNIPFQGVNIKIAAPPEVGDWQCTFLCDEAHVLRRHFMTWQAKAYDIGNMTLSHSQSYKSDKMGVAQLARDGSRVSIFGFIGAWPKQVGDIQVAHDQTTGVEMIEVTFSYDYYVMVKQFGDNTSTNNLVDGLTGVQIGRGNAPQIGNFTPQ